MSESKFKTMRHIETVRNYLNAVIREFMTRQEEHDQSKLQSPEVDIFEEFTFKLKDLEYGSEEYTQCLRDMKPALDHHYANNRHHPEFFKGDQICCDCASVLLVNTESVYDKCPNCDSSNLEIAHSGIEGMNLIDLTEMLVDWKASGLRMTDGCLYKSIDINQSRFGYSDELKIILINTAKWLECQEVSHHAEES